VPGPAMLRSEQGRMVADTHYVEVARGDRPGPSTQNGCARLADCRSWYTEQTGFRWRRYESTFWCPALNRTEVCVSFTEEEIAYMRGQPIARLSTVDAEDQPDVVPLSFEFDGSFFWVGGSGASVFETRKVRNIQAGHHKVALVIDDLMSLNPFIARGIRIYGEAEPPVERIGIVGPGHYMRITPIISWSWNLAGDPVGDTWYPSRRAEHQIRTDTS
jgi:pyridoxamine 5'-phosphate oxidase family protein